MKSQSPCTDICKLDNNGVCIGCLRTRDEVANWLRMSDSQKLTVIAALNERRKQQTADEHR